MNKYASIIFPDDKKKNSDAKLEAVEDAKSEMVVAISAANKVVRATAKAERATMSAVPFSPVNALNATRKLAEANEDLAELKAMEEAMF